MLYTSLLIMTLGYLSDAVISFSLPFSDDGAVEPCTDSVPSCSKLGRRPKHPLNLCYDPHWYSKCCSTCARLRLHMPDCQFGDREAFCSTIGKDKPTADCYAHNRTCCQTCHLYDSGIPGCPFGDRVTWCSGIGDRYSVQSCYDHEIHCCETCRLHRTGIPGCPYGDRVAWCDGIGSIYPLQYCAGNKNECCHTCHRLKQHGYSFDEPTTRLSTMTVTPPSSETTRLHGTTQHTPTPHSSQILHTSSNFTSPSATSAVNPEIRPTSAQLLTTQARESNHTFLHSGNEKLQHHNSNQEMSSEEEITLPGKPSINANKSITALNDTSVTSGTTVNSLVLAPNGEATQMEQTESPIYHTRHETPPINQGRNTVKDGVGYLGVSPTISSNGTFASQLRTDKNDSISIARDTIDTNDTIDPGGSDTEHKMFTNSSAIDNGGSFVDTVLHSNKSHPVDSDLINTHQNASNSDKTEKQLVQGVSSGASKIPAGGLQTVSVALCIVTFTFNCIKSYRHSYTIHTPS